MAGANIVNHFGGYTKLWLIPLFHLRELLITWILLSTYKLLQVRTSIQYLGTSEIYLLF